MFLFTRIILSLTAIGGFLLSIYLIPLVITYTCESLAGSTFSCLLRVGSVIFMHFFAPIFLLIFLKPKNKQSLIGLLFYGIGMVFMANLTGFISLLIGLFCIASSLYFYLQLSHKPSVSSID
jgi:hypothetical protein